jgi:hypothetical protein
MPKYSKQEQEEARERLLGLLTPGDTVLCVLRHVSSSGMMRVIQLVMMKDNEPRYLGYNAATLLGMTYDNKREGVKVEGCGMDMGFHLVYSLSRVLFPEGFGLWPLGGEHMPKVGTYMRPTTKDHAAEMVAQGFKFYGRNGDTSGWDNDGGYALKHRWL